MSENAFKKGDIIMVIDNGKCYTTHPSHKKYGCYKYDFGKLPRNGAVGRVSKVNNDHKSYCIEIDSKHYLIDFEGVDFGEEKIAILNEEREALIKELAEALELLLPMADESYRRNNTAASHEEFVKEDRDSLRIARRAYIKYKSNLG